ncbi:MAG: protein kinase [Deltaproteobacteria bacterium]|nr:protein kinase [Deltaproteobacteria bacterium]
MTERDTPRGAWPRVAMTHPEQLGRYVILHRLGAGMMGVVWAAYDPHLDRKVAVKVLHQRRGAKGEEARGRLVREARTMARLSHPHVVQVFDVGLVEHEGNDDVFLAMEYVEGQDLEAWVEALPAAAPARWRQVLQVFLQAGRGLAAAHAAGVVHRDFKPTNVLVAADGRAKVGDFGLARLPGEVDGGAGVPDAPSADYQLPLTATGDVVGTPAYMSPEQHRGRPADARSDQFAFAVALYEAVYGVPPFPGETFAARAVAVVDGQLRMPPADRAPPELWRVLRQALSAAPEERYPGMQALVDELESLLGPPRRTVGLAAGAVLLAAVVGAGVLMARPGPCEGASSVLAGVWDDAARARLGGAIEATGLPYAAAVRSQVLSRLDAYASAWTRGYVQACEATNVHKVQSQALLDRRMACLGDRRRSLSALVGEMARADVGAVERAVAAAAALPDLAHCADLSALAAEVDAPDDPATQASLQDFHAALAEARAQAAAGHYTEGLASVETASAALEGSAYAPAVSELRVVRGNLLAQLSRNHEAQVALTSAFLTAQRARHQPVAAEASRDLVALVGVELGQHELGLTWADIAEATLGQHAPRPRDEAALLGARARVLSAAGRREEAMTEAHRALALLEGSPEAGPYELGQAGFYLGLTQNDIRDYVAARVTLAEAVGRLEAALGPEHPELVEPLAEWGRALYGVDEFDLARAVLDRAVSLARRLGGPKDLRLGMALSRRAAMHTQVNEHEAALADFREARTIFEAAYGSKHTMVARLWLNMGACYQRQGRLQEAMDHYQAALRLREALLGPHHPDLAVILQNMGTLLVEAGRSAEAIELLRRSVALRYENLSAPGAEADPEFWLGRALYESGRDKKEGAALVRKAYDTFSRLGVYRAIHPKEWLEAHRLLKASPSPPPAPSPAVR